MTLAETYRANAAAERAAAAKETLPNRRAMYERSAEVWEERAKLAEETADKRVINDATKRSLDRHCGLSDHSLDPVTR